MNEEERLRLLHRFYEDDPADPFNAYALGMAYLVSDPPRASVYFDEVLEQHPEYLPVYYQAAKLMEALDEPEKARTLYRTGMELAEKQGQLKTLEELKRAARMLEDELEDW